jgi:hypothetical protein
MEPFEKGGSRLGDRWVKRGEQINGFESDCGFAAKQFNDTLSPVLDVAPAVKNDATAEWLRDIPVVPPEMRVYFWGIIRLAGQSGYLEFVWLGQMDTE